MRAWNGLEIEREVTWLRLLTLLAWTILVMIKRGISQLIETIEERVCERGEQTPSEEVRERKKEKIDTAAAVE